MPQTRTVLTTTTNPLVLVVVTWALLWGFGATQVQTPFPHQPSERSGVVGTDAGWEDAWSRRFPGCVALPLWPRDERPVAVVTRDLQGEVARRSPGSVVPPGSRVVGACR